MFGCRVRAVRRPEVSGEQVDRALTSLGFLGDSDLPPLEWQEWVMANRANPALVGAVAVVIAQGADIGGWVPLGALV